MPRHKPVARQKRVNEKTGVADPDDDSELFITELQLEALCDQSNEISDVLKTPKPLPEDEAALAELLTASLNFITTGSLVDCIFKVVVRQLSQPGVLDSLSSVSQSNEELSKYIEFENVNCCFTNVPIHLTPELKRRWLLCVSELPTTTKEKQAMIEQMEYVNGYDSYISDTGPYMFNTYQLFSKNNYYHWHSHPLFEATKDLAFNQQTFCANIYYGLHPYTRMLMETKNKLFVDACKELSSFPSERIENGPIQKMDADALWLWLCSKKTYMERISEGEEMLVTKTLPSCETCSPVKTYSIMYDTMPLNITFEDLEDITLHALEENCVEAVRGFFSLMRIKRMADLEAIKRKETWENFKASSKDFDIKLDEEGFKEIKKHMNTSEGMTQVIKSYIEPVLLEQTSMLTPNKLWARVGNTKNKLAIVAKNDETKELFMLPDEGLLPDLSGYTLSIAPVSIVHYKYGMKEDTLNSGELNSEKGVYDTARAKIRSSFPQQSEQNEWESYRTVMQRLDGIVYTSVKTRKLFSRQMGEFWSGSQYNLQQFQVGITVNDGGGTGSIYSIWPQNEVVEGETDFCKVVNNFYDICFDLYKYTQNNKKSTPKDFKRLYGFYNAIRDYLESDPEEQDDEKRRKIKDLLFEITYNNFGVLVQHDIDLKTILEDVKLLKYCTADDLKQVLEIPLFYDDYEHLLMRIKTKTEDGYCFIFNRDTHFEFMILHGTFEDTRYEFETILEEQVCQFA